MDDLKEIGDAFKDLIEKALSEDDPPPPNPDPPPGGGGGDGDPPPNPDPPPGGGCFTFDQPVLTLDGKKKISELAVGDKVVSYDEEKDVFTNSVISKIIIHDEELFLENSYNKYSLIELGVNTKGKIIYTQVTENHLYYDPTLEKYRKIGEFSIGARVLSFYGEGKIVSKKILIDESSSTQEKVTKLYNLHLKDGPHNYLVNGTVVHNVKTY